MDLNSIMVEGIAAFFSIWANDLLWQTQTFKSNEAINTFQAMTMPLVAFFAVAGMIVAAIRILWYRRLDPTMDLLKGILTLIIVTFAGLSIAVMLMHLASALSGYFLDVNKHGDAYAEALGGALSEESQDSFLEHVLNAVGSGFAAIITTVVGVVIIIALIVQIGLIYLIQSFVYVLACVLPLAASATVIPGTQIFQRVLSWTLAAIFYKPVLAFIYALGFTLMGQSDDGNTYMVGVAVILLASGALPGLLKLFKMGATKITGAFGMSGGGAGGDGQGGGVSQGSASGGGSSFGGMPSSVGAQMAALAQGLPSLSGSGAGGASEGGRSNRGAPSGNSGLPSLNQANASTAEQKSPTGGQAVPASLGGTQGSGAESEGAPVGDGAGQGNPEVEGMPTADGSGDASVQSAATGGSQASGGPLGAGAAGVGGASVGGATQGASDGVGTVSTADWDTGDAPGGAVSSGGPGVDNGGWESPRGASGDGY